MGDHEGTLHFEYDDFSMKTKFFMTRFGGTYGNFNFDEKPSFSYIIGCHTVLGI